MSSIKETSAAQPFERFPTMDPALAYELERAILLRHPESFQPVLMPETHTEGIERQWIGSFTYKNTPQGSKEHPTRVTQYCVIKTLMQDSQDVHYQVAWMGYDEQDKSDAQSVGVVALIAQKEPRRVTGRGTRMRMRFDQRMTYMVQQIPLKAGVALVTTQLGTTGETRVLGVTESSMRTVFHELSQATTDDVGASQAQADLHTIQSSAATYLEKADRVRHLEKILGGAADVEALVPNYKLFTGTYLMMGKTLEYVRALASIPFRSLQASVVESVLQEIRRLEK